MKPIDVLVVDDEPAIGNQLKVFFELQNDEQAEYRFTVDTATTVDSCIATLRQKQFQILVLDVRLSDRETEGGLDLSLLTGIQQELGWEATIRIVVTGYPNYRDCVQAARTGVWDYILKEDVGSRKFAQIVIDSATRRLRELDCRKQLEQTIYEEWLPIHHHLLEREYAGQVVALWHEPEIGVIASGSDVFALHEALSAWTQQHEPWQKPLYHRFAGKP